MITKEMICSDITKFMTKMQNIVDKHVRLIIQELRAALEVLVLSKDWFKPLLHLCNLRLSTLVDQADAKRNSHLRPSPVLIPSLSQLHPDMTKGNVLRPPLGRVP